MFTSTVDAGPPAQKEMVPFRSAKMKREEVAGMPGVSWKEAVFVLLTDRSAPEGQRRLSESRRSRLAQRLLSSRWCCPSLHIGSRYCSLDSKSKTGLSGYARGPTDSRAGVGDRSQTQNIRYEVRLDVIGARNIGDQHEQTNKQGRRQSTMQAWDCLILPRSLFPGSLRECSCTGQLVLNHGGAVNHKSESAVRRPPRTL